MIFLNPLFPSFLSRHSHHRPYRPLVISALIPAINTLLISMIAIQFGPISAITRGTSEYDGGITTRDVEGSNSINASYTKHRTPAECTQQPRFSILTSEALLRSANVSYDERKSEIWTFGRVYLVLECIASTPIDFDFDGHLINTLQSVETTRKTFQDPKMPSCYSISIIVETNRESTGTYRCWSLKEPILSTSLYMFAHGGTPPYLLHADIGNSVIEVETDIRSQTIIIPCVVTNPNISVALYKIDYEDFTLIQMGEHISYDPKVGFVINVRKFPDPYAKYKCIAMNSTHYDVIVNVKQPTDNFFHEPVVQGRLEVIQDRFATQSFICNSSSLFPVILTTTDCKTPIECRLAQKCLRKNPYCSVPCRCPIRGDNCSQTLLSNYAQIRFPMDVGCTTVPANTNGGVIYCSAKNFEPSAQLTYFIGLSGLIVQNWKGVGKDELVQVSTVQDVSEHTVYFVGEMVEFRCIASRFMFSRGFQWKIKLQNGTILNAEAIDTHSQISEEKYYIAENRKVKISHPDISSVLCYVPVWNETDWVHNALPLVVKHSVPPTLIEPENVTVTFFVNRQNNSLLCEAEGFPSPDIIWYKNGDEYIENLHSDYSLANITSASVLLTDLTVFDDGAIFLCNATNPRGTVVKTFTIQAKEEVLRLTLTLVGVAFILLLGLCAIVLWICYTNSKNNKLLQLYSFTEQEVEAFFNGNPEAIKKCGDGVTKAMYHAYDSTFEISMDDLEIDYRCPQGPLGAGQFGVVFPGKLQNKQGARQVAVKTTKDADVNQLRALVSEIKIMMYIGKHENVVDFIGAVTKDLKTKKREVLVVVEYCEFGNLEDHLRKDRGTFYDEFGVGYNTCLNSTNPVSYSYVRLKYSVKTSDLINWAYQILSGLEFLTSKKVIHGDVALRNVLLDANQVVKITDFGLSKHIYTQGNQYIGKKKDVPVPWRWFAPESLQDNVFSAKSDCWSFGVLLYELFSLAELPYTGINYNDEFIGLLKNGYRLNKPPYANDEIYAVMRDCWRLDPKERPTFTALRHFFLHFKRMQHPINQSEIIQQMQYRSELDTDSSDLDREDSTTMTTFVAPTLSSGSSSRIHGQRPRGIVG